jgi:hypothetical protein
MLGWRANMDQDQLLGTWISEAWSFWVSLLSFFGSCYSFSPPVKYIHTMVKRAKKEFNTVFPWGTWGLIRFRKLPVDYKTRAKHWQSTGHIWPFFVFALLYSVKPKNQTNVNHWQNSHNRILIEFRVFLERSSPASLFSSLIVYLYILGLQILFSINAHHQSPE